MKKTNHGQKKRFSIIVLLLLCILLTGCSDSTKSFSEVMNGIKTLFSTDETFGRMYMLSYAENLVAADCKWDEAEFEKNWFHKAPKLAEHIAIVSDYQGYYCLHWREKDEGEDFFQSLNDMALQNGYECITVALLFKTDDFKREEYKYTIENVEKEDEGWGDFHIKMTLEWSRTESDLEYNIVAFYNVEFSLDEELTKQKKEEQNQ